MQREQTTIRLTVRPPADIDKIIRKTAKERETSINQLMLTILNQWAKFRRSGSRNR